MNSSRQGLKDIQRSLFPQVLILSILSELPIGLGIAFRLIGGHASTNVLRSKTRGLEACTLNLPGGSYGRESEAKQTRVA